MCVSGRALVGRWFRVQLGRVARAGGEQLTPGLFPWPLEREVQDDPPGGAGDPCRDINSLVGDVAKAISRVRERAQHVLDVQVGEGPDINYATGQAGSAILPGVTGATGPPAWFDTYTQTKSGDRLLAARLMSVSGDMTSWK